jgi:hypothetical protein
MISPSRTSKSKSTGAHGFRRALTLARNRNRRLNNPAATWNRRVSRGSTSWHSRGWRNKQRKNNQRPMHPFVLYSIRHTFLTRLGESGCDAWTLARIAGHGDIRYSDFRSLCTSLRRCRAVAMSRLGGHKSGQSENEADSTGAEPRLLTQ